MKNFLSVKDAGNIDDLINTAVSYKANPLKHAALGKGKRIGLLFLNPSLRTRLSTQIAAQNLGMEAVVFNVSQDGWALEFDEGAIMNSTSVEHIKDAAPVLGKYFDILGVRTFPSLKNKEEDYSEHVMKQFVKYSGLPVVSLESATVHPLQSLADLITISENITTSIRKPKVVLTWAPHVKPLPQCVSNSFCEWVIALDKFDFIITNPKDFDLDKNFTGNTLVTNDQAYALYNADFVYVKNWSSYKDYGKIKEDAKEWMLTNKKLESTNNAKVMHCLPVRRNVELSDEILDNENSLVTEQAANRVWAAQSVLSKILTNTI